MEILKRKDAKKIGANKYFTGKPCTHGHLAQRWVINGCCVPCHSLQVAKYFKTEKRQVSIKNYLLKNQCALKHKSAREVAAKTGVPFTITVQDVQDAFPTDGKCPAFGTVLDAGRDKNNINDAPTLSRKKYADGYTPENICIISYRAARIKALVNDPEMLLNMAQWLKNIEE